MQKRRGTSRATTAAHIDYKMLVIIMVLAAFGLTVLYSASVVVSYAHTGSNTYYFFHQLLYGMLIGLVAMFIMSKINYHFWQKVTPVLVLLTLVMLVAVLKLGVQVGNSRRWIDVLHISVQPSEIAKLVMIFYIASWIDKRSHQIKDFAYGLIPTLVIIGLFAGLIILEPDIGTMLVLTITGLVMLYVGGSQLKHLFYVILAGAAAFAILVKLEPYRLNRFITFLNPGADPKGIGYQINQALQAIGSGGFWGFGYGHSRQKYNFLPEVIGDSIFAVIVEELGFLRALIFIVLYLFFALRGIRIAKGAPDVFGKMVGVGIITWVILQAFINIGAIIGVLPLTGIPLPFVSYGSSALIVTMAAMGVLLNISKQSNI